MGSWFEPLLDPAGLIGSGDGTAPRHGLGLLLEAQFGTYSARAKTAGWPEFNAPLDAAAPIELQALAATGRVFGEDDASGAAALRDLSAAAEPTDLSLVLALLAAVGYALREELGVAREILSGRLSSCTDPIERSILLTHLGLRAFEDDDLGEAVAMTREARGDLEPVSGDERLIWAVATYNLRAFEQRLPFNQRTLDATTLPVRSGLSAIIRGETLLASGLDEYLDAEFESALVNPYQRTTRWQAQDPIERGLLGALIRGECLADWNTIGFSRRSLGRYRVLAGVGRNEEALGEAFDLLRRAGDENALGSAARLIVRLGPLATLRKAVVATVDARWTSFEILARLALLAKAADLLKPDEAGRALARVLETEVFVRNVNSATETAAALLAVAPLAMHVETASTLLRLANENPDSAVGLQSLPRTLHAIHWLELSLDDRAPWLQYVRTHLGQGGEPGLLAQSVAVFLASSEPQAIAEVAATAFEQRPTLGTVAVFLDAQVVLPSEVANSALDLALESLGRIRDDAAQGAYAFGGLSVALIVFELIQSIDRPDARQALCDFLLDPAVSVGDKTRTLDAMASPVTKVDVSIADRLKPELHRLGGAADAIGDSADEFQSSALRLALKINAATGTETLATLLRLSSNGDPSARIQAALTLPRAAELIGADVAFTLALRLTDDPHPDVRAHAARALASRFAEVEGPLATAAYERLQTLLLDAGSLVPQATIAGLLEARRAGRQVVPELVAIVGRLQLEHPSHGVGQAAQRLLKELSPPASGR